MDNLDDGLLERQFCSLSPIELYALSCVCRHWRVNLDPCRLPWREAVRRMAGCHGFSISSDFSATSAKKRILLRWQGVEVAWRARSDAIASQLFALPLAARPTPSASLTPDWPPDADYHSLLQDLSSWSTPPAAVVPEMMDFSSFRRCRRVLPICPMCAGIAFYQGTCFTRSDIATGWQAYMLCSLGSSSNSRHPLLATLLTNMGVLLALAPKVAVQLRSRASDKDSNCCASAPNLGISKNLDIETVDSFSSVWRGPESSMVQNMLSISLPCSHRLSISGHLLADLGVVGFFCEQVGKTACASLTRVGRYLDDHPTNMPRAHIFGIQMGFSTGLAWLPPGCLEVQSYGGNLHSPEVTEDEPCPFCGLSGLRIRGAALKVSPWEVEVRAASSASAELEEEEEEELQPFNGSLWVCAAGDHLWGWRARRRGVPVSVD